MTGLVLGWSVAVVAVFLAAARPWRFAEARAPLPLVMAFLTAAWALWDGARIYADLMAQGLWTAATVTIAYVPVKAILMTLLAYLTGRAIMMAVKAPPATPRRFVRAGALTAVLIAFFVVDVQASADAARQRTARSAALTPDEIAAVQRRIESGAATDGEITAFLGNPLAPPEFLARYTDADARFKAYVTRNPSLPSDALLRLSRDADANVRLSAVYNPGLVETEFPRLAQDSDTYVREAMTWKPQLPDADFARLLNDPEARVRAAAVLQPRAADDELRRLAADSDESVRRAAARMMQNRGLE
jgi:hypothetical protein